jgi:histidyl-tRNA synthetase
MVRRLTIWSHTPQQKVFRDISSLYTEVFTANGWSQVSNVAMPDSVMLGTEYGENNSVGVYAVKDTNGVAVTLTVSIGK